MQGQLKDYEFLAWINPFIKTRKSKSNFNLTHTLQDENTDDDNEDVEEEEQDNGNSLFDISGTTVSQSKFEKGDNVFDNPDKKRKISVNVTPPLRSKAKKTATSDSKKEELMSTMSLLMQQRINKNSSKNDEEERFGGMVASELTKLPEFLKVQAKHEINGVIYKYQMQNQQHNSFFPNTQNPPSFFPVQRNHDNHSISPSSLSSPNNPFEGNKIGSWLAAMNNKENLDDFVVVVL